MPQISPMNWILIISMFYVSFLMVQNGLPSYMSQGSNLALMSSKSKLLKW